MIDIFFSKDKYALSDYNSPLSTIDAENYIWMNFLNPAPSEKKTIGMMGDIDNLMSNIRKKVVGPILIFVLFMVLTLDKVNVVLFKILPNS